MITKEYSLSEFLITYDRIIKSNDFIMNNFYDENTYIDLDINESKEYISKLLSQELTHLWYFVWYLNWELKLVDWNKRLLIMILIFRQIYLQFKDNEKNSSNEWSELYNWNINSHLNKIKNIEKCFHALIFENFKNWKFYKLLSLDGINKETIEKLWLHIDSCINYNDINSLMSLIKFLMYGLKMSCIFGEDENENIVLSMCW